MSEPVENSNADSEHVAEKSKSVLPKKTIAWVGFLVLIIAVMRFGNSWLDDQFGIGLDYINVATYLVGLVILASLFIHFLFFSKFSVGLRVASLILLVGLPAFVKFVLRPVPNGDIGIARFEPIWESKSKAGPQMKEVDSDPESLANVDLSIENDFDFPRFLGGNQNAWVENPLALAPSRFSNAEEVWKQPIGLGWSGFAVRNNYAVTMEQRDEMECVTCYDVITGNLKWKYEHAARHLDKMRAGGIGPRSTPTIDNGFVYAMGALGNFVCLKGSTGELVWQVDMNDLLGIELIEDFTDGSGLKVQYELNTSLAWGRAGSPLIVDDKVVVAGGGPKTEDTTPTTLIAFDKKTGEVIWRGGEEGIAYGSPTLVNVSTVRQIMIVAESLAMGFDPETGELLWEHPRAGESGSAANCSQVTVVSDNYILTSKSYNDGGGELIALEIEKGKLVPKSIWTSTRVLKTKLNNPIIVDGHSYAISNGFLECVDLADGARIWKHGKRMKHGQILKSGNYLLVHSEEGRLHLVDPTPEGYRELGAFNTVDGVCWNTFSLYGPYLLVRSELEAACFKLPIEGDSQASQGKIF